MLKKTLLSFSLLTPFACALYAQSVTLYQDTQTGAIYTKPSENRIELGDFIGAKEQYIEHQTTLSKLNKKIGIKVKSGVPTLKFSGVHYLGYTYHSDDADPNQNVSKFETRRNYFQVKAYWNKHDYVRITLDTKQSSAVDGGSWVARLKYAYLYLSNILPYTGVEFGQVHRPWIDYAEHHGWLYRSISETFVETRNAAHTINSASPGINFKTKTNYFTSEVGLFNDGGYHSVKTGTGQSFEWRFTYNALGTGKHHVHATEDEWLNVSFYGRYLMGTDNGFNKDTMTGLHAVYNNPIFLIAGHWMKNRAEKNHITDNKDGKGWSINGEFRPIEKWSILARYDQWKVTNGDYKRKNMIGGVAYQYNKNVKFIANGIWYDPNSTISNDKRTDYMLTAEIKW
jgi:hypothetical protein